jgi:hypothetical protein
MDVNVGDCNGSSISKSTLSDLCRIFLDWWHSSVLLINVDVWCLIPFVLLVISSSDTRFDNGGVVGHVGEKLNICVGDVCCCCSSILFINWDSGTGGVGVRSSKFISVFVWSNYEDIIWDFYCWILTRSWI